MCDQKQPATCITSQRLSSLIAFFFLHIGLGEVGTATADNLHYCRQKAWVSAPAAQTLANYDRSAMLRKSRLQAARQVLRN